MPFCKQCGKEIPEGARFCPYCGADQGAYVPPPPQAGLETKNSGLAAVLALVLGFFGIWGVGHIYVGKIGKGIALLILGIILQWVIGFFVFFGAMFFGFSYGFMHRGIAGFLGGFLVPIIIWGLITLAIFIWQVYDAYKLAKYYNEHVQRYGKAPW